MHEHSWTLSWEEGSVECFGCFGKMPQFEAERILNAHDALLAALKAVRMALSIEHGPDDYEPECPLCSSYIWTSTAIAAAEGQS